MSEYLTDEDRLALLKQWWEKYGNILIVSVVLSLFFAVTWQVWQKRQSNRLAAASSSYQLLLSLPMNDDSNSIKQFSQQAKMIVDSYPKTPYATLSSLLLAKISVEQGNYSEAYGNVLWAMNHAHDKRLKEIARIRAARILIEQSQYNQALQLLRKVDDKTFMPLIYSVSGDTYLAQKHYEKAKQFYQKALSLPNASILGQAVILKLNSLPVAS